MCKQCYETFNFFHDSDQVPSIIPMMKSFLPKNKHNLLLPVSDAIPDFGEHLKTYAGM